MADYEHKNNSGSLFKNTEKKSDNHPDYSGSLNIEGVTYRIAAWAKDGAKGKFLSIAASIPLSNQGAAKTQEQPQKEKVAIDPDELPF